MSDSNQEAELEFTLLALYDALNGNTSEKIIEKRKEQEETAKIIADVKKERENFEQALKQYPEMKDNLSKLYDASIPSAALDLICKDYDNKMSLYSQKLNTVLETYCKDLRAANSDSIIRIKQAHSKEIEIINQLLNKSP